MKCTTVQKLLTGFLDGELSEKKRTSIHEHLAGCDQCSQHLEGAERALRWAGTWTDREVSPAFLARLKGRIRAEKEPARHLRLFRFPRAQPALAAVAVACLIFLGGYFVGVILWGGEGARGPSISTLKPQPPIGRSSSVAGDAADSERLIIGVQKIKMVFGGTLSEKAYDQLNEVQRVLAARGHPGAGDLAVVEELQRAEALIRQGEYSQAQETLDAIAQARPDHPLMPYVRMTRIFASAQPAGGSRLLDRTYATLIQETVGNPREFYEQVSAFPAQMAQLRDYSWEKIVENADRLNPLNALSFLERRILGVEENAPMTE